MAKEYVVETALYPVNMGTVPIELQVPDHRHIYVDDKSYPTLRILMLPASDASGHAPVPICCL